MNDALVGHAIDHRDSLIEGVSGSTVVTTSDGCIDLLDVSTDHGTERCIVASSSFSLTGSFTGLWRVSQFMLLRFSDLALKYGSHLLYC